LKPRPDSFSCRLPPSINKVLAGLPDRNGGFTNFVVVP
jgi:hypothetical protein